MLHKWWEFYYTAIFIYKVIEIQKCGQILCAHKPYFLMAGNILEKISNARLFLYKHTTRILT